MAWSSPGRSWGKACQSEACLAGWSSLGMFGRTEGRQPGQWQPRVLMLNLMERPGDLNFVHRLCRATEGLQMKSLLGPEWAEGSGSGRAFGYLLQTERRNEWRGGLGKISVVEVAGLVTKWGKVKRRSRLTLPSSLGSSVRAGATHWERIQEVLGEAQRVCCQVPWGRVVRKHIKVQIWSPKEKFGLKIEI